MRRSNDPRPCGPGRQPLRWRSLRAHRPTSRPFTVSARCLRLALAAGAAALAGCASRGAPAPAAGANVVIVLVDALRADHLGCYGYALPTSPFIDQLAARGILFERARSTASQTVPSVLSLWTSAYPSRHGNQYFAQRNSFRLDESRSRPRVPDDLALIAEDFARLGYATGAVVANPWLHPDFGFARGFERYVYLPAGVAKGIPPPLGRQVNDAALGLLEEWKARRFLLYVHYMDVHNPYRPPEPYRSQFVGALEGTYSYVNGWLPLLKPADVAFTRAHYDGGIRALDDFVRELVGRLDALGLTRNTLVVFVADHGDEFQDHGGMGHGWTLYEEMVHTPLLLVHPGLGPARRIGTMVSLVDLLPTLLELTGAPVPPGLDGVSLAPLILGSQPSPRPRALFSELGDVKAVRVGDRKLIRTSRGTEQEDAFDLAADPGEQHPVTEHPPWREALAAELGGFLARGTSGNVTPVARPDAAPRPLLDEQLRALGYVN